MNVAKSLFAYVQGKKTSIYLSIMPSRYGYGNEYLIFFGFQIIGFPETEEDGKNIILNALKTSGVTENIEFK